MDLLLLTKMFPYGTEEAFIENEIIIACQHFDRVYIVACEVPRNEVNKRHVPDNCYVKKINSNSNKRVQMISDFVKSFALKKDKAYLFEKRCVSSIPQSLFVQYFESKAQRIARQIVQNEAIRELTVNQYILYSYWLFTTARIGMMIGDIKSPALFISRAHRYDLYEERNGLNFLPYREQLLKTVDMVFPCSSNGEQYLIKKYPSYENKINVSYLGTIDHGMNPDEDNSIFRIISCSRVEPVKRVIRIAEVVYSLAMNYNVEWTHIGDGSLFEELKSYIKDKNLSRIVTLKGKEKNANIMKHYQEKHYDIFINVSSSEGLPVSIMEAISFGLPVVATDVGGTSEIVNSENGYLVDEMFSNEQLIDILENLITNRELLKIHRKAARNTWEKTFQANKNYESFYSKIEKLLYTKTIE